MKKILVILAAALAIVSCCDEEKDWTPGPVVAEGTPVVYFSKTNDNIIPYLGDENPTFDLKLERQNANGSLTVPINIVVKNGEIDVPESVTFADGETEAVITVAYKYVPGLTLKLALGEGYGDPYLVADGSLNFWCKVARRIKLGDITFYQSEYFKQVKSELYNYEGINRFAFTNFFGSGLDMDFMIDTSNYGGASFDPKKLKSMRGDIVPVTNYIVDENGDGWFIYDDKADDYPEEWTVSGYDKPICYLMFYNYSGGSYSYISLSSKSGNGFITMLIYNDDVSTPTDTETAYFNIKYTEQ